MPGRHSLRQFLKSAGLLARGHAAPLLDELLDLGRFDGSLASLVDDAAFGGRARGIISSGRAAAGAAVGAFAVIGVARAGRARLLLRLVLQLLDDFIEPGDDF